MGIWVQQIFPEKYEIKSYISKCLKTVGWNFKCTFTNLGWSIKPFDSTIGLNIHFIGHSFDFIGQPVIQRI